VIRRHPCTVSAVCIGLLLDVLFELDTTIKTSARAAVPAPTAGVREVYRGVLGVLCCSTAHGSGRLWLCPAHDGAIIGTWLPARDEQKQSHDACDFAVDTLQAYRSVGLNGFFAYCKERILH